MHHFVVVYRVNRNRVQYMDPARGEMIRKPGTDFSKVWSGVVLLLMPATQFSPASRKTTTFRRFGELISPHRALLVTAFACALVYTLLGLTTAIYIQEIFDFVIPGSNRRLMNQLGLIMLVALLFQMVAGYFKSLIALRTGRHIDARLILGYYRHLMKLPQRFFDNMRVGEIISRVNDAVRIRTFINDTARLLLVHIMTIAVSTAAMFLYNWKLALMMMLVMPVYGALYMIGDRINERWQRKIMEAGAGLESHLLETISGIAAIRRFAAQEYFNRRAEKKFMLLMRAVYKSGRNHLALNIGTEGSTRLMTILILWTGTYFVMRGELSPGALLSFYVLTGYFTTPVQALIGANKSMQGALIAADRLFEILDLETEKRRGSDRQAAWGMDEGTKGG
jgi:ATP-binding cassette subfamily B protein